MWVGVGGAVGVGRAFATSTCAFSPLLWKAVTKRDKRKDKSARGAGADKYAPCHSAAAAGVGGQEDRSHKKTHPIRRNRNDKKTKANQAHTCVKLN